MSQKEYSLEVNSFLKTLQITLLFHTRARAASHTISGYLP